MKIAYFTESLPPLTDGVTRTMCHLVETLEQEHIDYRFFSPVKPDASFAWHHRVRQVASVPVIFYNYYRLGLPYFHGIADELDSFAPDLVHIVSPTLLGMYGMSYALRRRIPVVSSYHTHFVAYFAYYGFKIAEELGWGFLLWFHNRCRMTFAPSLSAVAELKERGVREVALWQRGIDLHKFSPTYRSADLRTAVDAETKPLLLFVGRLVKEKDLDDLVAANDLLQSWGYDFKLVIVGDGPMRGELAQRLPGAYFTGYQHGKELSSWYASADIFVFPSTTETFGNVVLEAFASALPVVGVDKGGVADLVHPGINGLVARAHNPEDFAQKTRQLLDDTGYAKKLGQQASAIAASFHWQNINQRMLENCREIVFSSN